MCSSLLLAIAMQTWHSLPFQSTPSGNCRNASAGAVDVLAAGVGAVGDGEAHPHVRRDRLLALEDRIGVRRSGRADLDQDRPALAQGVLLVGGAEAEADGLGTHDAGTRLGAHVGSTARPTQATAHSTLVNVPMMNRSAAPVSSWLRSSG